MNVQGLRRGAILLFPTRQCLRRVLQRLLPLFLECSPDMQAACATGLQLPMLGAML